MGTLYSHQVHIGAWLILELGPPEPAKGTAPNAVSLLAAAIGTMLVVASDAMEVLADKRVCEGAPTGPCAASIDKAFICGSTCLAKLEAMLLAVIGAGMETIDDQAKQLCRLIEGENWPEASCALDVGPNG